MSKDDEYDYLFKGMLRKQKDEHSLLFYLSIYTSLAERVRAHFNTLPASPPYLLSHQKKKEGAQR